MYGGEKAIYAVKNSGIVPEGAVNIPLRLSEIQNEADSI